MTCGIGVVFGSEDASSACVRAACSTNNRSDAMRKKNIEARFSCSFRHIKCV